MNRPVTNPGRARRSRSVVVAGLVVLAALVAMPATLVGCGLPLSPADLDRNENHFYPGRSRGQVYKAALLSLKTLGFEVVAADEGSGRIKTAPKVVTATAYGSGYSAVATENAIGWNIDVFVVQGGTALHAEPRGYSGGQVVPPQNMNGDYLERLFGTLYGEIDSNLPYAPGQPPGAPPPPR